MLGINLNSGLKQGLDFCLSDTFSFYVGSSRSVGYKRANPVNYQHQGGSPGLEPITGSAVGGSGLELRSSKQHSGCSQERLAPKHGADTLNFLLLKKLVYFWPVLIDGLCPRGA